MIAPCEEPEGAAATAAAIRAHLRRTLARLADVVETDIGWVARSEELPLVHTLNQVRVTGRCSPEEARSCAETHQGGLPYRHLVVEDPRTASALHGVLRGWSTEREVLMALGAPPSRTDRATARPDRSGARIDELSEEETSALMASWVREAGLVTAPGVAAQLDAYQRREGRLWDERRLGVRDARGEPVAMTKLRSDGAGTAWVEDVYALPGARGRGYGRALVAAAVERARAQGHRLTFILADDEDWPKDLYARVGFRPVARTWAFHLDLGAAGT